MTEADTPATLTIGEAAQATGVSAKMIRYYEQVELIRAPTRTAAGYRLYGPRQVHTLRFIQRARALGFSVDRMRGLLALWQNRERTSADVKALAMDHIAELDDKIEALKGMRDTLHHLADHCHGDQRPDCPILEDLAGPADGERSGV